MARYPMVWTLLSGMPARRLFNVAVSRTASQRWDSLTLLHAFNVMIDRRSARPILARLWP